MTKGENVIVAVIYDGVDSGHSDLRNSSHSQNYLDDAASSSPEYRKYGTRIAGIIGACQNEEYGMMGVAPECKIMSVAFNFFNGVSVQQIATGMLWAMNNGAHVICLPPNIRNDNMIDDAIKLVLDEGRGGNGCVLLMGSGKSYDNNKTCMYPSDIDSRIIVVGAAMKCGARAKNEYCEHTPALWDSCYGDSLDVVAPGVSIFTTAKSPNYPLYDRSFEGTEAACAHVAGIAALVLSVNPDLTAEAVDFIIGKSARKERTDLYSYQKDGIHKNGTWNNEMGYGFVDATAAVEMANTSTTYVWNQKYYNNHHGFFENTNVDVKNVTVGYGDFLHIFKEKRAILRSSVRVGNGGEVLISYPLEK